MYVNRLKYVSSYQNSFKLTYNPNSTSHYNRIKETFRDRINWEEICFDVTRRR